MYVYQLYSYSVKLCTRRGDFTDHSGNGIPGILIFWLNHNSLCGAAVALIMAFVRLASGRRKLQRQHYPESVWGGPLGNQIQKKKSKIVEG